MPFQPGSKPLAIGTHRRRLTPAQPPPPLPFPPPVIPSGDPIKDVSQRLARLEQMMAAFFAHLDKGNTLLSSQVAEGFDAVLEEFSHHR